MDAIPGTESPSARGRPRSSLRLAILLISLALIYALGLSLYKTRLMERFARESLQDSRACHVNVLSLFQASFYFFYEDQFLPGVRQSLVETPNLKQIQIVSAAGSLIFDSVNISSKAAATPSKSDDRPVPFSRPDVVGRIAGTEPSLFFNGFTVQVLMPAGQYGILYTFVGTQVMWTLLAALLLGLVVLISIGYGADRLSRKRRAAVSRIVDRTEGTSVSMVWGLRSKFLLTIVLVNLITGGIVFFTLSELQTREETNRIQKESILFSQFSTAQVISDFSSYFYFYYNDKFLPGIKTIIATNENLLSVRIVSRRTGAVLFDSEKALSGATPSQISETLKSEYSPEMIDELKTRDAVSRFLERGGERLLSVVNTYRNENREALFYVEYLFTFQSLKRSIGMIRKQILIDLVPALALGLVIAVIFAQLLISPVRRLVAALQRISSGDYDVSVEVSRSDEIGELVTAFNSMAIELRKKKELRKYLSDSTYRQIMEAPDTMGGARIGVTRIEAAVLFTDIRNFVSHCESADAEEVTSMLNEYFSEMVEVVYKHGGEVDKFIGDAILAVFYGHGGGDSPSTTSATDTSLQAIYCAMEMRERLQDFNLRRQAVNKATIEIGVGINHGEIISGPIGSKDRMDFTVIGDVVNVASRIEKMTKQGRHTRIAFSNRVEEKVRGLLEYESVSRGGVRGKEEDIEVFELIRVRDLESLLKNVASADVSLRLRSIELLGQSRNPAAIPYLISHLGDSDQQIRQRTTQALGRLAEKNDPKVLDALFARLKEERSDKALSALVSTIGKLCSSKRILELKSLLDSADDRIVANTVEAMGQSHLPEAIDLIVPKLSSRNNRVKANAAMVLFASGHTAVIDTLKPMLMYSDPSMRSSAAFAIGELALLSQKDQLLESWKKSGNAVKTLLGELQECVPMLVSLLRDSESAVKRQAVIALGKIKDKSAVLPMIDRLDFEKDSPELLKDVVNALQSIGSHKLVREVIKRLSRTL